MLIGEPTFEAVKDVYCCRFVDYISLKGKNRPINVYEPLGRVENVTIEQQSMCTKHDDLRVHLHAEEFDKCRELCRTLLEEDGSNEVVRRLLDRLDCENPTKCMTCFEK
jgi:hypothetical protein